MATSHPVHDISRPSPKLLWHFLLASLVAGPLMPLVFAPLLFKYNTLSYRFDEEGVSMSWGYFWRREIHLTYARIQDIHLTRGLVERWLGLATIQVQTASGNAGAEMAIMGLPQFEEVRDYLYARMRGAREGDDDAVKTPGGEDEATRLMTEIRDELRGIRARMEARA